MIRSNGRPRKLITHWSTLSSSILNDSTGLTTGLTTWCHFLHMCAQSCFNNQRISTPPSKTCSLWSEMLRVQPQKNFFNMTSFQYIPPFSAFGTGSSFFSLRIQAVLSTFIPPFSVTGISDFETILLNSGVILCYYIAAWCVIKYLCLIGSCGNHERIESTGCLKRELLLKRLKQIFSLSCVPYWFIMEPCKVWKYSVPKRELKVLI